MSRDDSPRGLTPSLLDRLTPGESSNATATRWTGASVDQLIEAVRRDLEALLNTRQTQGDLPGSFVELTNSVFTFGVPDVSILSTVVLEQGGEIGPLIAELIGRFEPRLRDVQVVLADQDPLGRQLRFHIEGRLRIEPFPELGFDTVFELSTGRAVVTPTEE